jgi:hypothetical protein
MPVPEFGDANTSAESYTLLRDYGQAPHEPDLLPAQIDTGESTKNGMVNIWYVKYLFRAEIYGNNFQVPMR